MGRTYSLVMQIAFGQLTHSIRMCEHLIFFSFSAVKLIAPNEVEHNVFR